jgi:hypothetical protein
MTVAVRMAIAMVIPVVAVVVSARGTGTKEFPKNALRSRKSKNQQHENRRDHGSPTFFYTLNYLSHIALPSFYFPRGEFSRPVLTGTPFFENYRVL